MNWRSASLRLLFLFFSLSLFSQTTPSIDPALLNDWQKKSGEYLGQMQAVQQELLRKKKVYETQPPDPVDIQLEQRELENRLAGMDKATRQVVLNAFIRQMNQRLPKDGQLIFTGGTEPGGPGFRAGFGDYDLESTDASINATVQLMRKFLPPDATIKETPDYIAVDELRFTIFKRRPIHSLDDFRHQNENVMQAAGDKEVYLHLRLPAPPDTLRTEADRQYQSLLAALETEGHIKKGIGGLKASPEELFAEPERLQTFAKSAWKSMRAAGLGDADLETCLAEAGATSSAFLLKWQIESLKADLYLNPYLAGLNPENMSVFQAALRNILQLAGEKAAAKAREATDFFNQTPGLAPEDRQKYNLGITLYDLQRKTNQKKIGAEDTLPPLETIEGLLTYFHLPEAFALPTSGSPLWRPYYFPRARGERTYSWANQPAGQTPHDQQAWGGLNRGNTADSVPTFETSQSLQIFEFADGAAARKAFLAQREDPVFLRERAETSRTAANLLLRQVRESCGSVKTPLQKLGCDQRTGTPCRFAACSGFTITHEQMTAKRTVSQVEELSEDAMLATDRSVATIVQSNHTYKATKNEEQQAALNVVWYDVRETRQKTIREPELSLSRRTKGILRFGRFIVVIGLEESHRPKAKCLQEGLCDSYFNDVPACHQTRIVTAGGETPYWEQIEQRFRRLVSIPQRSAARIEVENEYKGLVSDGANTLRITALFPSDWNFSKVTSAPASLEGQNLTGAPTVTSQTPGKVEITFHPAPLLPPFTEVLTFKWTKADGSPVTETKAIEVIRPPVVFVHGIWSGRSSLMPLREYLIRAQGYPVEHTISIDYGAVSNQDLRKAVPLLAGAVDRLMNRVALDGYKIEKLDVVAHSMGGLIARYYLERTAQALHPVTGQSRVRKLITLNTPHMGSSLADWYTAFHEYQQVDCASLQGGLPPLDKMTENEYQWLLGWLREKAGMADNPIALSFGEAVRQLQTPGKNGSIYAELNPSKAARAGAVYYFIAGNKTLVPWCELLNEVILEKAFQTYPYFIGQMHRPEDFEKKKGPCGEFLFTHPEGNLNRTGPYEQTREFLAASCQEVTDGVVHLNSQLFKDHATVPRGGEATFELNHFSITSAPRVFEQVKTFLFEGYAHQNTSQLAGLNGAAEYTNLLGLSPGYLQVYDAQRRRLGRLPDGRVEERIPGGALIPFTDIFGPHEYAFLPTTQHLDIRFLATGTGAVDIRIGQFGADGLLHLDYEDIAVQPGDLVSILPRPENPAAELRKADGEVRPLSPAYQERGEATVRELLIDLTWMPTHPGPDDDIVLSVVEIESTGRPLTYEWRLDGQLLDVPAEAAFLELGRLPAGEYQIQVAVTDSGNATTLAARQLTVTADDELDGVYQYLVPAGAVLLLLLLLIGIRRRFS